MAVRKVSNKGGNVIGYFPSTKMGCMVAFESTIERDLIYVLEFEPDVKSFAEQPFAITYIHEGKERTYTPDFQADLANGCSIILECKPQPLVNKPENQLKFMAGKTWCAQNFANYQVVTDDMLRAGLGLPNIKFLYQFARHSIPANVKNAVIHEVKVSRTGISVLEIAEAVTCSEGSNKNLIITAIFQMVFFHELYIDLFASPINVNSLITMDFQRAENNEYAEIFNR